MVGEAVERPIELTLLLRKGERDRPGRPAARPAQQLPSRQWCSRTPHPIPTGARLWATPQPQQLGNAGRPIQGARVLSSQNQRSEMVGEAVERPIELTLLLRKGERDRPGRPAARPAQQPP